MPFKFKPDPTAASPLYMQLAQKLAQAIRDGVFQADEALPSERVLSEQLELSRVTARKAIDRLVEQGMIVRKRGSGNYIAPKLEQPLSRLTSFSEELQQRGFKPSSRWLTRTFTAAAPDEQLSLGLSTGGRVARLERLRLADTVVMAYEVSVLPESVLPDPQAVQASLYEHLQTLGGAPVRALQHIRAINADSKLAGLLEVPVGQAVLFITRVGYLESGHAVELTHSYCRSDYYDFVAEMRREG
ncbi:MULTISPECIES: GntR family transcriptional regulator [unclassified Roseateles]|uniref:GntR family transcriptional regulator n=1 Tax=unclassified Roseateles TaxID=2626991 RepID=UPI000733A50D|nr:GntR family transcriptional regulator [Paucibacter sp. KCTC 42545]ALT79421.1 GntR family transcriptional regulator [Paucibacter sp. KCTC 42545]MBY0236646.1 GntR family transcriptional regulator [Burkholderiaceae bacterium]